MINSDFFRRYVGSGKNPMKFTIDDEILKNLRTLNSIVEEGGYHKSVLTWKYLDNQHLSKEDFTKLFPAIQFITMLGLPKEDFINKYDVKEYHISLLRRTYIEFDDYEGLSISIGYKRPFGNSYVEGDVEEEISRFDVLLKSDDDDHSHSDRVLSEFVEILNKMIIEEGYTFKYYSFEYDSSDEIGLSYNKNTEEWSKIVSDVHHNLRNWKPSVSEYRDLKIKKIFN